LIAICMMKVCLLVRMTEGPCRLLCLAKMRHLPSGVTAKERLGSTFDPELQFSHSCRTF